MPGETHEKAPMTSREGKAGGGGGEGGIWAKCVVTSHSFLPPWAEVIQWSVGP